MKKNCDTCAYQTSKWKVCTNKRKKAEVNQELLKEKEYCHDYIVKDILFSNFKATRYMYDGIFVSEVIERSEASAEEQKKEEAIKIWLKLREECTINGKFSCLELIRKHLSVFRFRKAINDSRRIS